MSAENQARSEDFDARRAEPFRPVFRVVGGSGGRRALKLETVFWDTLGRMAGSRKSSLTTVIDDIAAQRAPEAPNLSSAIRVACLNWALEENQALSRVTSLATVNAILAACPSPAFALSSAKRILAFNPSFQALVRRQLPILDGQVAALELKLALDLSVADVFERLAKRDGVPVATGFSIQSGERRHRGKLNLTRAPVQEPPVLLGFVA